MNDRLAAVEQTTRSKVIKDKRVSIFDKPAGKGIGAGDFALQIHRLNEIKPTTHSDIEVNLSKGRSNMNHTGTFI